jgi:hypothetical protein
VGSRTSGGERVEVFAQGIGAHTEDFRRLTVQKGLARTSRRWFAEKGYQAQMRSFFASLRGGEALSVTVMDGARATLGCLAMLESARTSSTVAIDLPGAGAA